MTQHKKNNNNHNNNNNFQSNLISLKSQEVQSLKSPCPHIGKCLQEQYYSTTAECNLSQKTQRNSGGFVHDEWTGLLSCSLVLVDEYSSNKQHPWFDDPCHCCFTPSWEAMSQNSSRLHLLSGLMPPKNHWKYTTAYNKIACLQVHMESYFRIFR